jgi:hypothetical protein
METGEARWDSVADILMLMPFDGRHLEKMSEIRRACRAGFPLGILVRRPEEMKVRYRGGDPLIREAMDHGLATSTWKCCPRAALFSPAGEVQEDPRSCGPFTTIARG